ncbi:branched-chain amino acid ABC transporter permease [Noviherbaspirillum saxi]|uniref:Branched-chain amino acid ABC transporter permease n=1 Tax=Noviherbaspirillum saxi TaxID=2320863 RepID=A0A3A3G4U7_9BURK|nr:branched-chain amino acid ABC transporter permease [Noviherbaspirillum saxi]RJF95200.1 branched-chain amino acid ABC transporter permease [Noviherbaspirillum saxi]
MDFSIAAILVQDGITSGAIYALLALAIVLVFSVTRVIFIPQGEFVAYGALTLAALQAQRLPLTCVLLLAMGVLTFVAESAAMLRNVERHHGRGKSLALVAGKYLAFPATVFALTKLYAGAQMPLTLQVLLALLIVIPMGPMLYRLAYQPLAKASVLMLLIVSVSVHLALTGLGLVMFGAEGVRTQPFSNAIHSVGALQISGQSLWVIGISAALIVLLYLYFEFTLSGKALRATAVNGLGAQLLGISPTRAGKLTFTLAAAMGALCGILIAPMTTIYYESGFLIGLKGFVGSIFGGLASYPAAAAGAFFVGLLESQSSFWASAFKEVIVFTLILPVLLWRSLTSRHAEHEA